MEIRAASIEPLGETSGSTFSKWLLDGVSVAGAMAGSLMVAMNSADWSKWGYVAFMLGAIASLCITLRSNVSRSQVFLNGWFIFANVIGLCRWFGVI